MISFSGNSQDAQRSQYYAIPLDLNPAYTGTSDFFSAYINYRVQYPGLQNEFVSYNFSGDYHFKNRNSGVGLSINDDQFGEGIFSTTSIQMMFANGVDLNQKLNLRFGLRGGLLFRRIGFSDLIYGDQINGNGTISGISAENVDEVGRITIPTIGTGLALFHEKYWFGIAGDHLNTPTQSLISNESKLPTKLVFHAGYKFGFINARGRVKKGLKEVSISPMAQYKIQGPVQQFDIGVHFIAEPVMFGIWYRGLPLPGFEKINIVNNDALIAMIGLKMDEFRFYYSYDVGISALHNSNGGAHEITMSYRFGFYKNGIIKTYPKMLPMPIL